jgi:hypothetical protein
MREIISV